MKNIISAQTASKIILITLILVVVFHLLIIFKIIPYKIVWGGRLTDDQSMIKFELASILINLLMIAIVAVKSGILSIAINRTLINILLWIMTGLFLANTIGNLFSNNIYETIIFTPLTLFLTLLCLRLALSKP